MNNNQLEYIKDIYENGRHLLSLINNILHLTKIDVNKMECDLELVDVREILKGSIKVITIKANEKNIELSVSISESINEIEVDIRKFKQILFNLLSNAVKFTPKGGKIILQAEKVSLENVLKNKNKYGFAKYPRVFTKYKEYLSVSVIDTGIGITREDQKKLFIPFVQINSGLSKEYEGTGLGLALVKELVELHNGTIVVESELKKGSNFTFFIPYRNSK
jgi:signal transduction histidine kinase